MLPCWNLTPFVTNLLIIVDKIPVITGIFEAHLRNQNTRPPLLYFLLSQLYNPPPPYTWPIILANCYSLAHDTWHTHMYTHTIILISHHTGNACNVPAEHREAGVQLSCSCWAWPWKPGASKPAAAVTCVCVRVMCLQTRVQSWQLLCCKRLCVYSYHVCKCLCVWCVWLLYL